MKLKYHWQRTIYSSRSDDFFCDVSDHVRLRVRRRAARSVFFYGMMNREFCGMWKNRERAQAAMERIYDEAQTPAPQQQDAGP